MTSREPAILPADAERLRRLFEAESGRLRGHVAQAGRLYPGIWKLVDERRAQRRHPDPDWPEWCFLPFSEVCAILAGGNYLASEQRSNLATLAAMTAWRVTQGVYHFDPSVFDALWDTPLEEDIPCEVLYRLPEWCVYVNTQQRAWMGNVLHGFFVHLDLAAMDGHPEIRFLLDLGQSRLYTALPVDLSETTLARAVESARRRYLEVLESQPENGARHVEEIAALAESELREYTRAVTSLMNLALYLCSSNAEIRAHSGGLEQPRQPRTTSTRKGPRMFPPGEPTSWEVGWRLGAALWGAAGSDREIRPGGSHASPRPHIRRSHWHSYWTGPRDAAVERSILVKWIPPVGVNVGEHRAIVPVIHKIPVPIRAGLDLDPGPRLHGRLENSSSESGAILHSEDPGIPI